MLQCIFSKTKIQFVDAQKRALLKDALTKSAFDGNVNFRSAGLAKTDGVAGLLLVLLQTRLDGKALCQRMLI